VLAGALELFIVSLGLTYYVATVGAGLRVIRRSRRAARARAALAAGSPAGAVPGRGRRRRARRAGRAEAAATDLAATVTAGWGRLRDRLDTADDPPARAGILVAPQDYVVYFLIPGLNEELVIGDTVRSLLGDERSLVVVVDDASDDRTGELALAAGGDRVTVVRRELPQARQGKGPALNAGFAHVLHDASLRGIPASRITVCVMDADGRLSDGALDVVLPLFEDQRVGGVQLPVRIRNRGSLLTVLQDLEFWGVCAVAQLGRMASGTVSLGGNGQFTRLAALLEIGPEPWQAQLTEDLDLSLALAARGWRLTSAAEAHVSQQGVTSLRALVSQRTRWYQGHMQAVRWLRELWTSRQLSHLAMLELTIYLLVPWALVLPWSIVFNYNLLIMVLWVFGWVATPGLGSDLTQKIATLAFWYTLSCLPVYMAGFLYGRQERRVGYVRAFFIGHLLLVGNYVTYAACWRAMYRLITGSHGWEKTRRTDERRPSTAPLRLTPALAMPPLARPEIAAPAAVAATAELTPVSLAAAPVIAALPVPALTAPVLSAQAPALAAAADWLQVPRPRATDDDTTAGLPAVRPAVPAAIDPSAAPLPATTHPSPGRHALHSTAISARPDADQVGTGRSAGRKAPRPAADQPAHSRAGRPAARRAPGSHRAPRPRAGQRFGR
jgi:1,2-diacylglycerol 3-beta-glucosyltransferase